MAAGDTAEPSKTQCDVTEAQYGGLNFIPNSLRDIIIKERQESYPLINDKFLEYDNMSEVKKNKVRLLTREALVVAVAIEGIDPRRCEIKQNLQHLWDLLTFLGPLTTLSQLPSAKNKLKNDDKEEKDKNTNRHHCNTW